MDMISRQAAKNKKVYSEERHEYVIPVAEIDWLPSAQPIDVQEAYYRGKIDGIKECTTRLKKMNEEFANGRHNLQTGGDRCSEPTSGHNTCYKQQHHRNDTP